MVIRPLIAYSQSDKEGSEYIPIKVITVESDEIFKQTEDEQNYLEANNEISEQLYQHWLAKRFQMEHDKRREGNQFNPCSCVSYAKYRTTYSQTVGNAINWPKNSSVPVEGGIVITNESSRGHVAYIEKVYIDEIQVIEANYHSCQVSRRTIKLDNPVILGYWQNI